MRHIFSRCLFFAFLATVPGIFVFAQNRNVLASQIEYAAVHATYSTDVAAYHSRLPLSTSLKVTNLDNNKTIEVRVMGRVSGSPGQAIHLSEEAALLLDIDDLDHTPVKVEVVSNQVASAPESIEAPEESSESSPVAFAEEQSDAFDDIETEGTSPQWAAPQETVEVATPLAATVPETETDSWVDEEEEPSDWLSQTSEVPPAVAAVFSENTEVSETADYSAPTPPPAPVRPAPQPPVRTAVPNRPPRTAVVTRQVPPRQPAAPPQRVTVTPETFEQQKNIRITVNVNGRDYMFEIHGDGQTASSAPVIPPASAASVVPPPPRPGSASSPTERRSFSNEQPVLSNAGAAKITPNIPDPNSNGIYRVQVGAFENRNLAKTAYDRLKAAGFNPAYEPYSNMHRVVISGVRAADIPQVARRLGVAGFSSAWIRREN